MATWLTHIRIAQTLLDRYHLVADPFLVGSIGPDCSMPCQDPDRFDPPKSLTHFIDRGYRINADRFFSTWLAPALHQGDPNRASFLTGYYAHLVTDGLWDEFIRKDRRHRALYQGRSRQKTWAVTRIKKAWEDLDRFYLERDDRCIFLTRFQHIESFPDYLPFYPPRRLVRKVREICRFYTETPVNTSYRFRYLDPGALAGFVADTADFLSLHDRRFPAAAACIIDSRGPQPAPVVSSVAGDALSSDP